MAVDGYVLQPDMMSVLVGVNDTCLNGARPNGIALPKYERVYRDFLSEMANECPDLKLVLCEPFVLDCGNVAAAGYSDWRAEIDERRLIVRKLCAPPGTIRTMYPSFSRYFTVYLDAWVFVADCSAKDFGAVRVDFQQVCTPHASAVH
jgi:hypothetical protein